MDPVDRASLIRAVKAIVYDARRTDSLHTITPRIIRARLEADFGLEEGTLKAEEHKGAIREAIAEATSEPLPAVAVEKRAKPKPMKRKVLDSDEEEAEADKPAKAQAQAKKRKVVDSDEEKEDEAEPAPAPKKARKSSSSMESGSKAKRASTTKQAQKQKQKQAFKSAEMVPTSDVEAESDAGDDDKMEGSSKVKVDSKKPVSKEKKPKSKAAAAEDSGSELSVLEDAAPKKKGKKKTVEKPAKNKKSTAESSPDDETIKKLKSFIKACGVNKVWGKVFKDISNPKEQIRILKGTLADLGMTGRMSMDKAKAIREKRELAQELEDVQQFAAAQGRGAKRKPAKEEVAQDDSEEENIVPAKRKTTARQTIDAFLQGQSSDDD